MNFRWLQQCIVFLLLMAGVPDGFAAEFRDRYRERETVTGESGRLVGDNRGATVEEEEPRHGGKRPSHSLWISWVAPVNGLATLRLVGDGFDALLGVYQVEPGGGDDPEIQRLERVAGNDDDRETVASLAQFGVRAGEQYEIAVDGFSGATGSLMLTWELQPVDELIPRVILVNADRAANVGETVTLSVIKGQGAEPKFTWFINDTELEDEESLTLVIRNFGPAHVGHYRVRVEVGEFEFFSESAELQISSEGVVTALARNKPEDALDSPLRGVGVAAVRVSPAWPELRQASGLSRGYNGTQIFNTVYAGRDLSEPGHCGMNGGASYWFLYTPPDSGALELDTDGSVFDTVLAVYTYDPPLLGYASLRSLDCDNNGGANGRTSRLRIACESGHPYLIVVDGVNGARGLTYLNYRLVTNSSPGLLPQIEVQPSPITARVGDRVSLTVTASGTAPLAYQWHRGATDLPSATNATWVLEGVRIEDADQYAVRVSNGAGVVTSPGVWLSVWTPPTFLLNPDGFAGRLRFAVSGPLRYLVEGTSDPRGTNWSFTQGGDSGGGTIEILVTLDLSAQFFRVRLD